MQIDVTGLHIDVTLSLKEYVNSKFERLERHFDRVLNVHVTLSVDKLQHKAEASMKISGNKIYANAIEGDMYAAIDGLVDKLDRQVVKHKEKLKDHHKSEGSHRNISE